MRNIVKLPPFGQFGMQQNIYKNWSFGKRYYKFWYRYAFPFVFQYTRIFIMTWTSIKVLFHDGSYFEL